MTKSYPNGATKLNKYIGSLLSYSEVYAEGPGGQRETWLDGTFECNNATEKPNKITFGKADGQTDFQHTFEYDLQSYTLSHNLDQLGQSPSDTKPLVQKTYIYNGADQLAQNLDGMSNVAKKYNHEGKRLKNSQIGDANVKNYVYDSSGNIPTKVDTTISYGSNPATGKRGAATAFNILYDRAGRTTRRDTEASSLQLSYDSFGLLASYKYIVGKTTNMTGAPDGKTVKREDPGNGGSLLTISDDYNIQTKTDGSEIITIKLPEQASTHASGYSPSSAALFTDVKGNVTHRFKSTDGSLLETITYDDFGTPRIKRVQPSDTSFNKTSTYESKSLNEGAELYDFGSRWYDPITGRFTTPDDILAVKDLARTDGLNRLAFENNDPINHADPSGHWSLSAVLGAVLGAALVSFDHRNERGGKFWGGYAATVLVNAAIGGATGALGAVATPANMVSVTERLGQAVGLAMGTATENLIGAAATEYARASLLPRVKTCLRELEMGVQGKDGDGQSVSGAGEEFQGLIEYGWALWPSWNSAQRPDQASVIC
ncbi:hypothetical protein RAB80_010536 [Fusarium oxysporum f. sp. vasinfectum]|nr:hypothetical protein RAB80_010536 [Fusarium oxysporum f. sp. vasinfectum]